jgi:hypothetical protein
MWNLTKHFSFGYLMGGIAASFISCFLMRNSDFAFWQLCAGYMVTACLSGVMFGGASKILGYPQASATDGRLALIAGAGCTVVEFVLSTATHSIEVGRVLLFVLPVGAAVMYTLRARREWRRRVLTGVAGALEIEKESGDRSQKPEARMSASDTLWLQSPDS